MAMFGTSIQDFLTNDVKGVITTVVTGKDDPPETGVPRGRFSSIDRVRQRPSMKLPLLPL